MSRLITTRNAENNKNTLLKFANRTEDDPDVTPYGEKFTYSSADEINVCLLPFSTEAEAQDFGCDMIGGRKAIITVEEAENFNEFTHIWVDATPDEDLQNTEYIVKNVFINLTTAILIIDKKAGN